MLFSVQVVALQIKAVHFARQQVPPPGGGGWRQACQQRPWPPLPGAAAGRPRSTAKRKPGRPAKKKEPSQIDIHPLPGGEGSPLPTSPNGSQTQPSLHHQGLLSLDFARRTDVPLAFSPNPCHRVFNAPVGALSLFLFPHPVCMLQKLSFSDTREPSVLAFR